MVELTVGSRFWYKDKLLEVVKYEDDGPLCGRCVFDTDIRKCRKAKCCESKRRDGNAVYFKEIEPIKEEHNA